MADLSKYSDEELLAMYGVQAPAPVAEQDSPGFFENVGKGIPRAMKRRALGLLQIGLEGTGYDDTDIYKDTKDLAAKYQREGEGTGVGGFIGEVAGDPVTAATLPFAAPAGLLGLAATGAGVGTAEGFTRPVAEGDSRLLNTLISGATGAIAAPVLGWVGGKVGQLGDYAINKGADAIGAIKRAAGNFADDSLIGLEINAGSTYDDFAKAVQGMSDDAIALFKNGINAGLSPRQSYLAAKAKDQGVTLTKGMLTQDPAAQRLEDYAAQGVLNQNASKVATATSESNQAAMRDWAGKLRANVSGSADALTDETSVADAIATGVKKKAAELKAPASEAYKEGMTSKARVATGDLAGFVPSLKSTLREQGIDFNASPRFKADVRAMEKITRKKSASSNPVKLNIKDLTLNEDGVATAQSTFMWNKKPKISNDPIAVTILPDGKKYVLDGYHRVEAAKRAKIAEIPVKVVPFDDRFAARVNAELGTNYAPNTISSDFVISSFKWPAIDKMKQRLNSRAQFGVNLNQVSDYATKQEILAYRKAASQFSEHTDNIITNGLLQNPDEAAAALAKAPALWKEYKQTIYGKDGKAALGKIVDYDMTDRQVADLFGSNLAGKGETQKVIAQLKNALGESSPEMGQVRGMFLNRLLKGALTEGDEIGTKGFGTTLNTQWRQFKTKNKALLDELYTPEMQKEIQDFVSTAYLMSARNASKVNPSGSGIVTMDGLISLFSKMGGGGLLGDIAKAGGKAVLLRGNSKAAIQSIAEPLKNLGSNTKVISSALRALGTASGIQGNRAVSDALRPTQADESPLKGLSDEELLRMYNEAPATEPDAQMPGEPLKVLIQPDEQSSLPQDIKQNEGLRHVAYVDTTGNRTVGYGFNMDSGIARKVWKKAGLQRDFDAVYEGREALSDLDAEALGAASFNIALDDATSLYDNFPNLSEPRQKALLDLSYQLGKTRLKEFDKFNAAVRAGKWHEAVRQLLKTKYASQVPKRSREVARNLLRDA